AGVAAVACLRRSSSRPNARQPGGYLYNGGIGDWTPKYFERNVQRICRHIFQIYEFPGKFWYRGHFYMAYLSQRRRPNSPIVRGSSPAQVGSKKIGRPGFHSNTILTAANRPQVSGRARLALFLSRV